MPEWWAAEPRSPRASEVETRCGHCSQPIRDDQLAKQCPECNLLLHARCYEDTEGGRAYQTPGCESCRHRCHWR